MPPPVAGAFWPPTVLKLPPITTWVPSGDSTRVLSWPSSTGTTTDSREPLAALTAPTRLRALPLMPENQPPNQIWVLEAATEVVIPLMLGTTVLEIEMPCGEPLAGR